MYTFLELVLMSDGTKLARVWDSSRYPKHYLYVEEMKQDETEFEEGGLLNGGEWKKNQNLNPRFTQWVFEEQDVRLPFYPHTHKGYEKYFDFFTAYGPHPVLTSGEDGHELKRSRIEGELDPRFPW